jgi:hypothetical protein
MVCLSHDGPAGLLKPPRFGKHSPLFHIIHRFLSLSVVAFRSILTDLENVVNLFFLEMSSGHASIMKVG